MSERMTPEERADKALGAHRFTWHDDGRAECLKDVAAAIREAEADARREALEEFLPYMRHKLECHRIQFGPVITRCTCGFDELRKEMK